MRVADRFTSLMAMFNSTEASFKHELPSAIFFHQRLLPLLFSLFHIYLHFFSWRLQKVHHKLWKTKFYSISRRNKSFSCEMMNKPKRDKWFCIERPNILERFLTKIYIVQCTLMMRWRNWNFSIQTNKMMSLLAYELRLMAHVLSTISDCLVKLTEYYFALMIGCVLWAEVLFW